MPSQFHTSMRHSSPGHWSPHTERRHVSSSTRHRQAHNRPAAASGSNEGSGVALLILIGLGWWAVSDLVQHAHHHHQEVIAFVLHAIASWLS